MAQQIPQQAPSDQRELSDPHFLVARLIDLAGGMSDGEKQVIVNRLREAGLSPKVDRGWPEEAVANLRSCLQMDGSAELDTQRVLELVCLVAEFVASMDQLAWSTWKTLAPRLRHSAPGGAADDAGRIPARRQGRLAVQVKDDLEKLRQLTAALIAAVSQAGRQFANRHLTKFSPAEIASLVDVEGGGLFVGKEVKCWRKYKELANAMDEASIESEIMEIIASYAESLMKGLGGNPWLRVGEAPVSGQVHWHEGLFLQPHHLQACSGTAEARLTPSAGWPGRIPTA